GGGLFTTAILTGVLTSGKFSGKSKVVTAEMKADPYHPDWKNYTGKDRGVGADFVKGGNGAKFADQAKLDDHFARHGSDFGAKSAVEYQAQADKFLTSPKPTGVLEKARPNGDVVRYNPNTDEFGVVSSGGSIRTYYKPDPAVHGKGSNLEYFNAQ
ncbi:hypothetical protein, partial [Pseudomonas syringae group genomosp. 3]|uniref:hypothetical protein n=1 Tax=Pseudomonas syringae group genomosp. 3 TaxID=251701 RepID=UPI001C7FED08